MFTRLEDLPNELFVYMFCTYFDGVQLYKTFFQLNYRFNSLLKSLKNVYLHLESSDDDKSINLFSTQVSSLYIGSKHKSQKFVPLLVHVESITLVDPTMIQIMNLLEISNHLKHASILCSSASESLRSCRFVLPESHSSHLEPKHCSLPLLRSAYIQISFPTADFRRIMRLCPNLIRLEIEIIDSNNNEESIIILNHYEHINIREFHILNLTSLDIFDIYIGYLPFLEKLYISMKLNSYPIDVFEKLSSLIHRINHLKKFHFRFSTNVWNLGRHELETLKLINPFFSNIIIQNEIIKSFLQHNKKKIFFCILKNVFIIF